MILRCVIVDDEEAARRRLRDLLADEGSVDIVAEAADGRAAVQVIDDVRPDLVFLDIRLPGLSGLQVLERVRHAPGVIFTTAFDQFAVSAFELHALDYVLKPFSSSRLMLALARARDSLAMRSPATVLERATMAFTTPVPHTVFVRERDAVLAVRLSLVERIEGSDDYSALHTGTREYLVFRRLTELETSLAPIGFVRVHRSHIVNLAHVNAVRSAEGGRAEVELASGARIPVSRSRLAELRRSLGAR
jgi:two-component system LytT family response regulator